jgi:hypothetical protein
MSQNVGTATLWFGDGARAGRREHPRRLVGGETSCAETLGAGGLVRWNASLSAPAMVPFEGRELTATDGVRVPNAVGRIDEPVRLIVVKTLFNSGATRVHELDNTFTFKKPARVGSSFARRPTGGGLPTWRWALT